MSFVGDACDHCGAELDLIGECPECVCYECGDESAGGNLCDACEDGFREEECY